MPVSAVWAASLAVLTFLQSADALRSSVPLAAHATELALPRAVPLDMPEGLALEAPEGLGNVFPDRENAPQAQVEGFRDGAPEYNLNLASLLDAAVPHALYTPPGEGDAWVLLERNQGVAQRVSHDDTPSPPLNLLQVKPWHSALPGQAGKAESCSLVSRGEINLVPVNREPYPKVRLSLLEPSNGSISRLLLLRRHPVPAVVRGGIFRGEGAPAASPLHEREALVVHLLQPLAWCTPCHG